MTSQLVAQSREHQVMKIATGALEFPTTELKEKAKTLSHIDLVVSQLPIEILYGLQSEHDRGTSSVCNVDIIGADKNSCRQGHVARRI
jgi:hypothetical protein